MDGVVEYAGDTYGYETRWTYLSGCSSVIASVGNLGKVNASVRRSLYHQWAGAIPYEEAMACTVGKVNEGSGTNSRSKLFGLAGELAEHALANLRDKLPTRVLGMRVGDQLQGVFWSSSLTVLGEGGYRIPEYLFDPQRSVPMDALFTKAVCVDPQIREVKLPSMKDLKPTPINLITDTTVWSEAGGMCGTKYLRCTKLKTGFTAPPINAFYRVPNYKNHWHPESSSYSPQPPWWVRWRIAGYRLPTSKQLLESVMQHSAKAKLPLAAMAGNFGTALGDESCRTVAYIQKLAVDNGAVMGSVFNKKHKLFVSAMPLIYRSPSHQGSVVAAAFLSPQPITWEWV